MRSLQSLFSLTLILVSVFAVSCSGPSPLEPPTYTSDQLQSIALYRVPVDTARDRFNELNKLIGNRSWVDVDTFIHGPLGLLRRDMSVLTRTLLPDDLDAASDLTRKLFLDLERLDLAVDSRDYAAARGNFGAAIDDLDAYLDVLPSAPTKPAT
ncbi:photosystem II protein PsbQ [Rubidibacter lacunae KORDI 51-2]|uniref:Photosystem II protein PsbQ n=2 Tax=Rubidibacter TaxID=582491 RepID=U5D6J8_9CHRO|nr:photosystem II protein PsbQ [Rubidibacter lacunae KORDI 51-2]